MAAHRIVLRMVRIGTAGWTIPKTHSADAPGEGSHLNRYANVLSCVEINTTFYRSHRSATWQRWAASTPGSFRFSVKFPKTITHGAKLSVPPEAMNAFCSEIQALGEKLGLILVQLPPSLHLEDCPAAEFFESLRDRIAGPIALEPRHASWFTDVANDLLHQHRISRVAANPSYAGDAADQIPTPGGYPGFLYYRLHGTPRTYYSSYDQTYLAALAATVKAVSSKIDVWVIFDNTALGHAFANASDLQQFISTG